MSRGSGPWPRPAGLAHSQGQESRPPGLMPTHQSLELLFGEVHSLFGHLVICFQGGLEDEWVIRVE